MDNFNNLKAKCVYAYTYVQLMGGYAEEQLKDAVECEPTAQKLEMLSGKIRMFLQNVRKEIDKYEDQLVKLEDLLKAELSSAPPSDGASATSTVIADVKDIKAEHTKLLSLKRKGSIEENTDDDFLEIYRIETLTGDNVIEEKSTTPQKDAICDSKGHIKSSDDSEVEMSDATLCSVESEEEKEDKEALEALEDKKAIEALEALGKDDDFDMDSFSDSDSESSSESTSSSSISRQRSTSPAGSSETSSEPPSSCKKTDQDNCDIYDIKPCYVVLQKIYDNVNVKSRIMMDDNEMREIDRLVNMATLDAFGHSSKKSIGYSKTSKPKKENNDSHNSDNESDVSSDDHKDDLLKPISDVDLPSTVTNDEDEDQLDDLLCTLGERNADESETQSQSESDESEKVEKLKKKPEKRRSGENNEEKRKRLRLDPLLSASLSFPLSGEDTDDESAKCKKQKDKKEPLSDDDKENISKIECISDSDSDSDVGIRKRRRKRSCVSSKFVLLSSESSDNSDCEFVDSFPKPEDGEKGRRNIRAIKSKDMLAKDTQDALRMEEERIERLNEQKKKISQSLSQQDNYENTGLILDVNKDTGDPIIVVDPVLTRKLKPHQKEGVKFMWNNCYESVERLKTSEGTGCILAHCMGLGKTLQAITLIHTLFNYSVTKTKHVLVVCPLSTVLNWRNEFRTMLAGAGGTDFNVKTISDKKSRYQKIRSIYNWHSSGGVLIMGYECFSWLVKGFIEGDSLEKTSREYKALLDPGPDLIICDEGHLIRNKTSRRARALMCVETKRRIVLTGTPLQNNLLELYQMVQFVKPSLLGTNDEFMNRFGHPILNGGYNDSTSMDIKLMQRRSHVLHTYLKETVQRYESSELKLYLPEKLDYVVFISLHQVQIELYQHYLALASSIAPIPYSKFLADYVVLRNVWSHPRTLQAKEKEKSKTTENIKRDDDVILTGNAAQRAPKNWYREKCPDNMNAIEIGPKFLVMLSIIDECEKVGDKVLIFSSFLANLDAIEYFLQTCGTKLCNTWRPQVDYLRMDGSVSLDIRNEYCNNFTQNEKIRVFLISQKVGGMGLNLFAANRVILMDVNFNPAMDNQSIYRTYRFGQTKKCYIYRLVSMGTMEETVYERSVTKSAISARVVDEKQIRRHFKRSDIEQMYRFRDTPEETRPIPRVPKDPVLAIVLEKHKELFKYHDYQALLENQLDEQLDEQEQQAAWAEFRNEQENARLQAEARNLSLAMPMPYDPNNLVIIPSTNGGQVSLSFNGVSSLNNNNISYSVANSIEKAGRIVHALNAANLEKHNQQVSGTKPVGTIHSNEKGGRVVHTLNAANIEKHNQQMSATKPVAIIQQNSSNPIPSTKSTAMYQEKPRNNHLPTVSNPPAKTQNIPMNQLIPLLKPIVSNQQKQNSDPSIDNAFVVLNDEVIQSENADVLLSKRNNEKQQEPENKSAEPPNKPAVSAPSTPITVPWLPMNLVQLHQKHLQRQLQPPVVKPVDLKYLTGRSHEEARPSASSTPMPVHLAKKVSPASILKSTSKIPQRPVVKDCRGGELGTTGETAAKISLPNRMNTMPPLTPLPRLELVPSSAHQPLRNTSIPVINLPIQSRDNLVNASRSQSQQSQNPINLAQRTDDGSKKRKTDVIEILD